VLKALSRSPDGRYASAEEMASEVLRAAAAENLVASPRDVGDWVRREIGETLADRRRKIQEIFGAVAIQPPAAARPAAPARPRYPTPKTNADGSHRLPAKTVQLGDIAARVATALANRKPLPESPPPAAISQPSRAQWFVVIASAILAIGALAVAIAYFVSSLSVTPKREKAPATAAATGADPRYVGDPPPAPVPPPASATGSAPSSVEQTTEPAASRLDPSHAP
jgi:hypothetical protein